MERGVVVSDDNNNNNSKGLLEYCSGISSRKSSAPPFLLKTYMLVEDGATNDVISWNDEGTAFVVWQPAEFARDLLPTLFKHSNFSSFVRQLNTYGFRKVATSRWEFCNERFRKGERELLSEIRRRKAWTNKQQQQHSATTTTTTTTVPNQQATVPQDSDEDQRSSSTSSSSGYTNLVHENKRLKKENGVLNSELTNMKRKCRELLDLVAKYSHAKDQEEELEEDERPMLFGVRLDVQGERRMKRNRTEMSESASILLSQSCK